MINRMPPEVEMEESKRFLLRADGGPVTDTPQVVRSQSAHRHTAVLGV